MRKNDAKKNDGRLTTGNSPSLRDSGLLLLQFFETIADAALIVDNSGTIIRLNKQTENLFGYRRDELLNQPLEVMLPERFRVQHVENRRAYLRKPLVRPMQSGFLAYGRRKDGIEFSIDVALAPLTVESHTFVACTIRDLTSRANLRYEIRNRIRDLEEADRNKDQFLMTLIHELRSPLAAIAYSAELFRLSNVDTNVRTEAANHVIEEINLAQQLINDLSELPRVKRGELAINLKTIDLTEVAHLAIEINRPLIEKCGHSLAVSVPSSPTWAQGDATRMAQVITNLLTNAAKYTPQGGLIDLSIEAGINEIILKVKDNGIGIPAGMLTRIFELHSRLDRSRQNGIDGMGIGLAFIRRLMEIQGGSVKAFSEGDGRGSEFVVRLPRAPASMKTQSM